MRIKKFRITTKRGVVQVEVDCVTGRVIKTTPQGKSIIEQKKDRLGYFPQKNSVYSFFVDWDFCKRHKQNFPKGSKCPMCP